MSVGEQVEDDGRRARVGGRLRKLRKMRRLTLEDVAELVDLSPSFLSMLERGKADVSLSRFIRLADFYGIRPSELLFEDETKGEPETTAPRDGVLINRGPGVEYSLLNPNHAGGSVVHATFEPQSGYRDVLVHEGHDFCWVLRGELVLLFGDREFVVQKGELIAFEGTTPHAFRNDSDEPAELLAFTTPPYW